MKNAHVLFALVTQLAGCDRPPAVDALAADPSRLHTLRAQCRAESPRACGILQQLDGA